MSTTRRPGCWWWPPMYFLCNIFTLTSVASSSPPTVRTQRDRSPEELEQRRADPVGSPPAARWPQLRSASVPICPAAPRRPARTGRSHHIAHKQAATAAGCAAVLSRCRDDGAGSPYATRHEWHASQYGFWALAPHAHVASWRSAQPAPPTTAHRPLLFAGHWHRRVPIHSVPAARQ